MRNDQPLWLPIGSVRALGFLLMLFFVLGCMALDRKIPDQFWALFGGVAGWYFGSRRGMENAG